MNGESTVIEQCTENVFVLGYDAKPDGHAQPTWHADDPGGDRLLAKSLDDPLLLSWREQHLGEDAARMPVLFEVGGDEVLGVWTGWRMGYMLCREFGAVAAWRVLQCLQDPQCGAGKSPG